MVWYLVKLKENLYSFLSYFFSGTTKHIFISVLIGLISGSGAIFFFFSLEWLRWFCLHYLAGLYIPVPAGEHLVKTAIDVSYRSWVLFLIPAIGGLISGLVVYLWAPEAEGHGTDAMIDAFHNKKGMIRTRVPFVKTFASILTLSTGGSAGREGPIAQIGAGFGSWLGRLLKLSVRERRIFLLAGCAAGLGAIFRAPLGAALTSVEVLYKEDFEAEAIKVCVISSVIAFSFFSLVFGFEPIFSTPVFIFSNPLELIFYAILGLLCAPLGIFYVHFFYKVRDFFRDYVILPKYFRPALGGLGVGFIALLVPQAIGGGYGYIQQAIYGELSIKVMILAAFFKIISTSFTIGSGGSGGVFGPTLFIGGMLGGVVGLVSNSYFPGIVNNPGAFVLVGMAAFFAGVAKAPLGALLMVSEMTCSYGLLPPLMLVSVVAIFFNRYSSIYEKQVRTKFQSPAHKGNFRINILSDLKVRDVFLKDQSFIILRENFSLFKLQKIVSKTDQNVFPVVSSSMNFVGIIALNNVRMDLFEESLSKLLVVGELVTESISLRMDQNLYDALMLFLNSGYSQIPVVEFNKKEDRLKILGMLRHEDVIFDYHREISERMQDK